MSKENRIVRIENRINLLKSRSEMTNMRLINKLERRLRKLKES